MVDRTMTGVYPILSTPFDERGRVETEDLRRETEWAIGTGVDGLGIAMASEVYKLTDEERDLVLRTVVDQAAGRVKVVMNTGAEGTDVAVQWSRRAVELGADALMIRPPTYMSVHPDEVVLYFKTIAGQVSVPIFLQDQGGAPVGPGLAVRIARERENLCYIKVESPPTVPRTAEVAALRGDSGLIIFGGVGGNFMLEEVRRGSVGTMPGCTIPEIFVKVWAMFQAGDEDGAEREFHRYAALMRTLNQGYGLPAWIYKEILVRRGIFKTAVARRPALPPDKIQVREIDRLMEELELGAVAGRAG